MQGSNTNKESHMYRFIALFLLASSAMAADINVYDFDNARLTAVTSCHIFRFSETELHVSCLHRSDSLFAGIPATYQTVGIPYEVVIFDGETFFERSDCYITQADPIKIECPEYAKFASGFE